MSGWLSRWLTPRQRSSRLTTLLTGYSAYSIPHPGAARRLKLAQCRDNLRYLLDHREQRLAAFADLLQNFAIDLRAGVAAADPRPLLDSLERWARAEWPGIHIDGIGDPRRWADSDKAGADIALSMLMDTAIVLGEIVLRRRADFAWQLDLDPNDKQMPSYRRVVVMRGADEQRQWAATVLDFESECIGDFDWLGRGVLRDRALGDTVLAVLAGGYDPLSFAAPAVPPTAPGFYDKAKYHEEAVREFGLPPARAGVPGAFFLGWLIDRDLYSAAFAERAAADIGAYRQRQVTAVQIYERNDASLTKDLLSKDANAFARTYLSGADATYWNDLAQVIAPNLPSPFHVEYGWEQQERINTKIDQRYAAWNDVCRDAEPP